MLVKFGRKGSEVKEYYLEDDSTVADLLDSLNISMDYDDVLRCSATDEVINSDDYAGDIYLTENAVYILDAVYLTEAEKSISDMLEGVCVNDMSTLEQKELIKSLVETVNSNSWDR